MRFLIDLVRFGGRQLIRHRAPLLAAALAYRTIFSLIPVLVLAIVMFKAFLGEEGMRRGVDQLLDYAGVSQIRLAPTLSDAEEANLPEGATPSRITPEIAELIQDFADKTITRIQGINFGAIAVVGIVLLIYGALSLIIQVEQSFNTICRAPNGRRLAVRLTNYWALLTLGPIFLLGGFFLSARSKAWLGDLPAAASLPFDLVTRLGLTWIILIIAYTRLPNARVTLRPAAVGAFIGAILWEVCKGGLARFATAMTDPSGGSQFAVYGSIALLPLFLLWVYATWLIVLFGLEVAFASQMVASGRARALERLETASFVDPGVGVVLMRDIAARFEKGQPATASELAQRSGLADAVVAQLLQHLARKGLLNRVEPDADTEAFALARPAERISAAEVMTALYEIAGDAGDGSTPSGAPERALLDDIRRRQIGALGDASLARLVADHPGA
ncbi:MAG TPA: hypothetical protein DEB06_04425 [Phycisphaerales bacterium]|nr:hypothetical protein [Phycisphaerales bacterium]